MLVGFKSGYTVQNSFKPSGAQFEVWDTDTVQCSPEQCIALQACLLKAPQCYCMYTLTGLGWPTLRCKP